jgi:hypothetical protein
MFKSFSGQDRCQLTLKEWKAAICRVRPSAMRESTGSGEVTTLTFIPRKNYFKIKCHHGGRDIVLIGTRNPSRGDQYTSWCAVVSNQKLLGRVGVYKYKLGRENRTQKYAQQRTWST